MIKFPKAWAYTHVHWRFEIQEPNTEPNTRRRIYEINTKYEIQPSDTEISTTSSVQS